MWGKLVWILLVCGVSFAQLDESYVSADLKVDRSVVAKGEAFTFGVHLTMRDHWHTYWENPGFSGLPTTLTLEDVPGLKVEPLVFPLPKKFVDDAGFITYGYDDETLLMAQAVYSGDASSIEIKGRIDWLECKQLCKPGSQEVKLTLNIGSVEAANTALFDKYRALVPRAYADSMPFDYSTSYTFEKESWQGTVTISPKDGNNWPENAEDLKLFPLGNEFSEMKTVDAKYENGRYVLTLGYEAFDPKPSDLALSGVLQLPMGSSTALVRLPLYPERAGSISADASSTSGGASVFGSTFWYYMLLAFIGGIILNLMPCVLPVLSLKVFSLVKESGDSKLRRVQLAWIYTLGIMASFLVLSLFLAASTFTSERLGVGFQYQNPSFVVFVSALIFVMGLSFMGVFPIGALNSDWLAKKSERGGAAGAFYHGALMTILSTPCTAPLLGAAYGWSMEQPPLIILLIFQAVALGLAFPYLVFSYAPALLKYLPKPGMWMEQFKVVMGFFLMATVIWLFYVMSGLTGTSGVIGLLILLLGLGLAAWIYGQTVHASKPAKGYVTALVVVALSVFIGMFGLFDIREPFADKERKAREQRLKFIAELGDARPEELRAELDQAKTTEDEIVWVPFNSSLLADYLAENKLVFVDFTADWCATCKVNETLVIDTRAVRKALADRNVVTMKADYTHYDPELTAILNSFQRAGVPMYVFYPGEGEPVLLPETITTDIFLDGLKRAVSTQTQRTSL